MLGCVNIARADVCFLPDGKDCEKVPYEEYGGTPHNPRSCFATKEEAMSARTDSLDSDYQNGDMWCLKQSCSGYNVTSMMPGGWVCLNCNDSQSLNYNKYKCSCDLVGLNPKSGYTIDLDRCEEKPNACPSNSTTNCVSDECHKCERADADNPIYSGSEECLVYNKVDAHCPKGYVPDKPSGKCYSTQDMLCGEGKCYQAATTIPDCSGEGKQLSDDNGACWCSCKEGYHDDGKGNCVKDESEVPDNGQCYASEDECITKVWSVYTSREKHACMQEGNCWIGKSYIQYVSHCGGLYELRKEGIQNIHLTPEYFSTNPYIAPGEYNIWTPNGASVVFDIQTDHSGERYALYASYLNVDSQGQSIDGYATYGNFEFKPGYRYVLSPECVSDETIYTASVYCNNTGFEYAECTFTDNGLAFDRVYVKLQGITNGNPDERYRTLTTEGNTAEFYMRVSGGTCWFGQVGGSEEDSNIAAYWRSSMDTSSSIYCEYKYKIGEYGHILRVY